MDHEYFMGLALKEARNAADKDEVPVGAVIVIANKIISRGHNQVELLKDSTAHAEILALTSAFEHLGTKYLPDATIFVTVEPCLMCSGALYWSKIGTVVYGASDEKNGYRKWVREGSPFHPKTTVIPGILAAECAFLMTSYFQGKRG